MNEIGIVTIGRNEGQRLVRCLDSALGRAKHIVYVDSGSTDGSVEMARGKGVDVVNLDMSRPFNMARGRNAGFHRLMEIAPDIRFVQFVDGDCEIAQGWLEKAYEALAARPDLAIVCGRRRERFREASIYNRLIDMEWDGKPGEARLAGGDVLMRSEAFRSVGGYDESLHGADDPEICIRLRSKGWKILRLADEMTIHDVAMSRFSQWWKRTVRAGRDFAEISNLHRRHPEKPFVRQALSGWFFGLFLPLLALALAWPTRGWSLIAYAVFLVFHVIKVAITRRRAYRDRWSDCVLYGVCCIAAKYPQVLGQSRFWWNHLLGKRGPLIEYK